MKKVIWHYLLIFFLVIVMGLLPPLFHLTFDFSILKANILLLLLAACAIYVYPILIYGVPAENENDYIIKLIISLFIVQSFIQIAAFTSEPFKNFVQFFQKDSVSAKDMGGLRALAITGNPFFDLSTGYGFCFLLFFYNVVFERGFLTLKSVVILIILMIGCFFAGRTAFVGLLMGLLFYLFSCLSFRKKLTSIFKLLSVIFLSAFVLYQFILPSEIKELVETRLLPFAFEFVYAYMDSGKMSTESTEILDSMYFSLPWETFLVGDGRYTGDDGAYYLHTDAGIMRNLLLYGIAGLLFNVIAQMSFFLPPLKQLGGLKKELWQKEDLNQLLFFIVLASFFLVIHYKGEILLFMPIAQILLIWVLYSFTRQRQTNYKNEKSTSYS